MFRVQIKSSSPLPYQHLQRYIGASHSHRHTLRALQHRLNTAIHQGIRRQVTTTQDLFLLIRTISRLSRLPSLSTTPPQVSLLIDHHCHGTHPSSHSTPSLRANLVTGHNLQHTRTGTLGVDLAPTSGTAIVQAATGTEAERNLSIRKVEGNIGIVGGRSESERIGIEVATEEASGSIPIPRWSTTGTRNVVVSSRESRQLDRARKCRLEVTAVGEQAIRCLLKQMQTCLPQRRRHAT